MRQPNDIFNLRLLRITSAPFIILYMGIILTFRACKIYKKCILWSAWLILNRGLGITCKAMHFNSLNLCIFARDIKPLVLI